MTANYQIQYSRFEHDYAVYVEGENIGSKPTYIDAEEMATEYISDLARQTAIDTADMLANAEPDADDYAECVSCGDLYACRSENSRPPYICPACKEVDDPLPGVCKNCYQPHPTYRCPEIWSYLRAGPGADVCVSCGDASLTQLCAACAECGERLAA